MPLAPTPLDILRCLTGGIEGVLVTLTGIEGSSSRGLGTQMAVLADGTRLGSFSGGCIEAAVVAEALEALAAGAGRVVRYGVGSPYLDIRLPCGGGIDLTFTPRPDPQALAAVLAACDARREASLAIGPDGVVDGPFHCTYLPTPRLIAVGQGEEVAALARLGTAYGLAVTAFVPDGDDLIADGFAVERVASVRQTLPLHGDAWTGIVFLFHDRDWEAHLLPQALAAPSCFIGAVGSRRTHQARVLALAEAGVPPERIDALRAPVGLIPATRDPAMLALSILAEVVPAYPRAVARMVERA